MATLCSYTCTVYCKIRILEVETWRLKEVEWLGRAQVWRWIEAGESPGLEEDGSKFGDDYEEAAYDGA